MYMGSRSTRTPAGIPYTSAWHGLSRLQHYTTIRFRCQPALQFLKIRGDFSPNYQVRTINFEVHFRLAFADFWHFGTLVDQMEKP
jgi:hypothetical protein